MISNSADERASSLELRSQPESPLLPVFKLAVRECVLQEDFLKGSREVAKAEGGDKGKVIRGCERQKVLSDEGRVPVVVEGLKGSQVERQV